MVDIARLEAPGTEMLRIERCAQTMTQLYHCSAFDEIHVLLNVIQLVYDTVRSMFKTGFHNLRHAVMIAAIDYIIEHY